MGLVVERTAGQNSPEALNMLLEVSRLKKCKAAGTIIEDHKEYVLTQLASWIERASLRDLSRGRQLLSAWCKCGKKDKAAAEVLKKLKARIKRLAKAQAQAAT